MHIKAQKDQEHSREAELDPGQAVPSSGLFSFKFTSLKPEVNRFVTRYSNSKSRQIIDTDLLGVYAKERKP